MLHARDIESLSEAQVRLAISALEGTSAPKGAHRFELLKQKLVDLFGQCTSFTSDGLDALESWTEYKVRGESALSA